MMYVSTDRRQLVQMYSSYLGSFNYTAQTPYHSSEFSSVTLMETIYKLFTVFLLKQVETTGGNELNIK